MQVAEVYRGPEEGRNDFMRWYRNEHLTNVDAIKANPYIKDVKIAEVQVPGIYVVVIITVADGHLDDVVGDPGVKEILDRAAAHGMEAGSWNPVELPVAA